MKFIRLILRRPATVFLLIFTAILFGITSLTSMPLEYMPDMRKGGSCTLSPFSDF